MSADHPITKANLDGYLKELGKEFRKRNGTLMRAEIILIGGAAVLLNYGFREMTYDIDAIVRSSGAMKEAINAVGDRNGLPNGWLNTDFLHTDSFTPKLVEVSKYYKTFSNIITVRTVCAEYLIAMKLKAGRPYKYDLSDVLGLLKEQEKRGEEIPLERIKNAAKELYGDYLNLPENSRTFIESAFRKGDFETLYSKVRSDEIENHDILLQFQEDHPNQLTRDNLQAVIAAARKKKEESGENKQK